MRKKKASVKLKQTLLILACVSAAASANAVVLNPRGMGQVLLYPYYTVNGGNQTLLTVGNSTEHGKAVKVRFLEGRNGREVLSFNVYLSPFDVWTAAIFAQSPNGPANLVTDDNSCTLPAIKTNTYLPALSDGRHYAEFRNYGYAGFYFDVGPSDLARTREGIVEIIEMGTVMDASPTYNAIVHPRTDLESVPVNCTHLQNGWATGGFWRQNPATDLHNPTGGLFGSSAIVNTAAGTMFTYAADALEEFRQDPADVPRGSTNTVVMNTFPSALRPSLADALTDPAHNLASASVLIEGRLVRADYLADTQGVDAVTAVLMSNTLSNDYIVDPAAGAQSEWVLSFPTRHFYTDEAIVGDTAIAPFTRTYPNGQYSPDIHESDACMGAGYQFFNREEFTEGDGCDIGSLKPPGFCPTQANLCYTTQAISMNQLYSWERLEPSLETSDFLESSLIVFLSATGPADYLGLRHGWMRLDLVQASQSEPTYGDGMHRMRPALDGTIFEGLPAIGFLATNFVNNNVQAGVLANYSGAFPYRSTARCTRGSGSCP